MTTSQLDAIACKVSDPHISEHERKANCHAYLHQSNELLADLLQSRDAHKVGPTVAKIGEHIDGHFLVFARDRQESVSAHTHSNVRAEVTAFGVNAMQIVTDFVSKLLPDADPSSLKNSFARAGLNTGVLAAATKIDSALSTLVAVAANEEESLVFRTEAFAHLDTLRIAAEHMRHPINQKELIRPFEGIHHHDHRKIANELVMRGWAH